MFFRISMLSVISLLLLQASIVTSSNISDLSVCIDDAEARCCEEDSSALGGVNDEKCRDYSENCGGDYVASCCYTIVTDFYFCQRSS
ncbi:hypothetical protein M405DRAFT_289703 [Rhizopogon salebrosus TDB-379]|nr:hypothetical protein M405DRAFT_289703 [Rhizopogon salebrosus TDB-379]